MVHLDGHVVTSYRPTSPADEDRGAVIPGYETWSIAIAALASTEARTNRQARTAARPWSTVQTGSLRVRTELTKARNESRVLFVTGPPNCWSGFFNSGR